MFEGRAVKELAKSFVGFNLDDNTAIVIVREEEPEFDRRYNNLKGKIEGWKVGSTVASDHDYDSALRDLDSMRRESKISALQNEIFEIKQALRQEKQDRKDEQEKMQLSISRLQNVNLNVRKLRLVCALATAVQFAITQKFPELKFSKFPFSCTINDIKGKIDKAKKPELSERFQGIIALFVKHGIGEEDIADTIRIIREIGTLSSHPTTMINEDGVEFIPSAEQLREYIVSLSESDLDSDRKVDASALLSVLVELYPDGTTNFLSTK